MAVLTYVCQVCSQPSEPPELCGRAPLLFLLVRTWARRGRKWAVAGVPGCVTGLSRRKPLAQKSGDSGNYFILHDCPWRGQHTFSSALQLSAYEGWGGLEGHLTELRAVKQKSDRFLCTDACLWPPAKVLLTNSASVRRWSGNRGRRGVLIKMVRKRIQDRNNLKKKKKGIPFKSLILWDQLVSKGP